MWPSLFFLVRRYCREWWLVRGRQGTRSTTRMPTPQVAATLSGLLESSAPGVTPRAFSASAANS